MDIEIKHTSYSYKNLFQMSKNYTIRNNIIADQLALCGLFIIWIKCFFFHKKIKYNVKRYLVIFRLYYFLRSYINIFNQFYQDNNFYKASDLELFPFETFFLLCGFFNSCFKTLNFYSFCRSSLDLTVLFFFCTFWYHNLLTLK